MNPAGLAVKPVLNGVRAVKSSPIPDDHHTLMAILPAELAQKPTDILTTEGLILTC